jgi:hypothetical protein
LRAHLRGVRHGVFGGEGGIEGHGC